MNNPLTNTDPTGLDCCSHPQVPPGLIGGDEFDFLSIAANTAPTGYIWDDGWQPVYGRLPVFVSFTQDTNNAPCTNYVMANCGATPQNQQQRQQPQKQPKPIVSPNACLAWQAFSWWLFGFNGGLSVASGGTASVGLPFTGLNLVLSNAVCSAGGSTHL
jgi:hypothetical protein